tara:strand:- start:343 stop:1167 length:825 start_codon:yes stop_codon:yes gene_type:complete
MNVPTEYSPYAPAVYIDIDEKVVENVEYATIETATIEEDERVCSKEGSDDSSNTVEAFGYSFYTLDYIRSFMPQRRWFSCRQRYTIQTTPVIADSLYNFPPHVIGDMRKLAASIVIHMDPSYALSAFRVHGISDYDQLAYVIALIMNFDFSFDSSVKNHVFKTLAAFVGSDIRFPYLEPPSSTPIINTRWNTSQKYLAYNITLLQNIHMVIPAVRELESSYIRLAAIKQRKAEEKDNMITYMKEKGCSDAVICHVMNKNPRHTRDIDVYLKQCM